MNNSNSMGEKNFLLLSMSTLNRFPQENYYATAGDNMVLRGVSQLEPGTKFFLRSLQRQGRRLDRIVIVESTESRETAVDDREPKDLSEFLQNNGLRFVSESGDKVTGSAVDFYKERIWQYICGLEQSLCTNPKKKEYSDKAADYEKSADLGVRPLSEFYPDSANLFYDIDRKGDNDNAIYDSIDRICSFIRSETADGSRVRLYTDIQGARRYETFVINAAVKMLEISGIKVAGSVAVDFTLGNPVQKIVDTTINDRIFDMVAGMNEFVRTGRGDTLSDFLDNTQKFLVTDAEKKLTELIRRISLSISLCNVGGFDKGLSEFAIAIEEYEAIDDEKKNPLFKNFIQDLKADYENSRHNLLENNPKMRVHNQILWCLDKKLYQQALTLVEAKIPDALVENRILYYGDNKKLKRLVNDLNYPGWGLPTYLMKKNSIEGKYVNSVWIKYVMNRAEIKKDGDHELSLDDRIKKRFYNNAAAEGSEINRNKSRRAAGFLKKYYRLCDLRNKINHGSDEEISKETIQKKVKDMLDCYKKLIVDGISLDIFHNRIPLSGVKEQKSGVPLTACLDLSGVQCQETKKPSQDRKQQLQNMLANPSKKVVEEDSFSKALEEFRRQLSVMKGMDGFEEFYSGKGELALLYRVMDYWIMSCGKERVTREDYRKYFEPNAKKRSGYQRLIGFLDTRLDGIVGILENADLN